VEREKRLLKTLRDMTPKKREKFVKSNSNYLWWTLSPRVWTRKFIVVRVWISQMFVTSIICKRKKKKKK